jgi:hypothetical protein
VEEKDERVPEQWVYAGLRCVKGKRYTLWMDPAGVGMHYDDKGSFAIGYLYDVQVRRTAESVFRSAPTPTGHRCDASTETVQEWAALDRAAQSRLATLTRERNAKREDALAELVDPLASLARKMLPRDRDALAVYVLRRIQSAH